MQPNSHTTAKTTSKDCSTLKIARQTDIHVNAMQNERSVPAKYDQNNTRMRHSIKISLNFVVQMLK